MWVGHRHAVLLPGKKAQAKLLVGKDIVVLNYELLGGWVDALRALGPRALVVDESHFVKDEGAQRTKLTDSLARDVPQDGLVLLASGTPALGETRTSSPTWKCSTRWSTSGARSASACITAGWTRATASAMTPARRTYRRCTRSFAAASWSAASNATS